MKKVTLSVLLIAFAALGGRAQDYSGTFNGNPLNWSETEFVIDGFEFPVYLAATISQVEMNKGTVRFSLTNTYQSGDVNAYMGMVLKSIDTYEWEFVGYLYDSQSNSSSDILDVGVEYSRTVTISTGDDMDYYYAVGCTWALWVGGGSGNRSLTVDQVIDGTPRPASNLSKTTNGNQQVLSWSASPVNGNSGGQTGYNVYRVPSGGVPVKLNSTPVTTTSYSITLPGSGQPSATDNVYVKAVDASLHLTDPTNSVSVTFPGSELEATGNPGSSFFISGNYPNPFNPSTQFVVTLSEPGPITLRVYSVLGQLVRTQTINGEPGLNQIHFLADGLSSGNYLYQITTHMGQSTGMMTLSK